MHLGLRKNPDENPIENSDEIVLGHPVHLLLKLERPAVHRGVRESLLARARK